MPGYTVWAAKGKTSLSVSSGSVNIGDKVTVTAKASGPSGEKTVSTMTLSFDSGILQFVDCSVTYGGGGSSVTATSDSFTVTLKAVAAGSSSISLSGSDGVVFDTNEELESMSGSSTSVKVNNAAGGGSADNGNTGAGGENPSTGGADAGNAETNVEAGAPLSADNSLKSLTISPGTLSPAFTGSNTKYNATVGNDVTSVVVSAVPVNEKATVESVTGNTGLAVGNNTVSVVVKAENGVTATYKIAVTRQAAEEGKAEEPADQGEVPEEPDPDGAEETITVDGISYHISDQFTKDQIPADFEKTAVNYHGTEEQGLSFTKGTLCLLYLVADDTAGTKGRFFVYEEEKDSLYPFVKLTHGEKYVIALTAPSDFTMPETWQQAAVAVDGENNIQAYRLLPEEGQQPSDFSVFYGINQDGTAGWYQFDALEGTYQRLLHEPGAQEEVQEEEEDADTTYLQKEFNDLTEQYKKEKSFARNTMAVLIFIAAVLLIIIINLLLHRHGKNGGDDFFDGDGSDDDSFGEEDMLPDDDGFGEEDAFRKNVHQHEEDSFVRKGRHTKEEDGNPGFGSGDEDFLEEDFYEEDASQRNRHTGGKQRGQKKKRMSMFRKNEDDFSEDSWKDETEEDFFSEEDTEELKRKKAREAFFAEEPAKEKASDKKLRKKKKPVNQDHMFEDDDFDGDYADDFEEDDKKDDKEEPVISRRKKTGPEKPEKDGDGIEIIDLNDL